MLRVTWMERMSAFYWRHPLAGDYLSVLITLFLGYHLTQTKIQMNGDPEFSEVLFKQVRVPRQTCSAEKNHGWEVSMTSLAYERARVPMPSSWKRPSANWQRWRSRYNFMVALPPEMLRAPKSWRSSTLRRRRFGWEMRLLNPSTPGRNARCGDLYQQARE